MSCQDGHKEEPLPKEFEDQVKARALAEGFIAPRGNEFSVRPKATVSAEENRKRFEHMSSLFKLSLELRVKNKFPTLTQGEAKNISSDIEASLTGYFREGGLSLTTTLFSDQTKAKSTTVPTSIIKFVNESSAKYSSMLMRQAFSTISIDTFVSAGPAERDYLGRIILEDTDWWLDPYKKASPEAEALVVTKHERDGTYHIIGAAETPSDSWFISDTSVLNLVDKGLGIITWPTIGFLRFASTLSAKADQSSADRAFQTLLLNCARSGLNILDEESINRVFGSRIDQDTIELSEELEIYSDIIEEKYGDSPEAVLRRVPPPNRYMAAVQLANEAAQTQQDKLETLEAAAQASLKRAVDAEKRLAKLERFEQQLAVKKKKGKLIVRKQKAKKAKKGKKRK